MNRQLALEITASQIVTGTTKQEPYKNLKSKPGQFLGGQWVEHKAEF